MKNKVLITGCALAAIALASPATAADFGGDCCADLEERIAELEATAARKGNRKVSLTVYGQVNEAISFWDDGLETNTYILTNDHSRTRFGFKGKAKFGKGWYAAYKLEIGVRAVDQGAVDAGSDDGGTGLDLRHSSWTIGNKTYGAITVGETDMAHEKITQSQTAKIGHFSSPDVLDANDSFELVSNGRRLGGDAEWDNLSMVLEPGEGSRGNVIRYDSPSFAGFKIQAHWGEDDIWGAALKYEDKLGDFKIAAGIGYGEMSERDEECLADAVAPGGSECEELGMSASVMHGPTGLFVTGAYGIRWDKGKKRLLDLNAAYDGSEKEELKMYHIQAGVQQKWVSLGPTTIFGGYHKREAGATVRDNNGNANFADLNGDGVDDANERVTDFEFDMWEVGLNQHISNAAMDIYLHYKSYDADLTTVGGKVDTDDWSTFIMGSRIKF